LWSGLTKASPPGHSRKSCPQMVPRGSGCRENGKGGCPREHARGLRLRKEQSREALARLRGRCVGAWCRMYIYVQGECVSQNTSWLLFCVSITTAHPELLLGVRGIRVERATVLSDNHSRCTFVSITHARGVLMGVWCHHRGVW
jgi:hypothetical protein